MTGQDDEFWRRPGPGAAGSSAWSDPGTANAPATPGSAPQSYTGPPPTVRPTVGVGWGPVIRPYDPPRPLPPQDHAAMDVEDDQARSVTTGVGILTLVILLLLLVLLVVKAGTLT
jgi:hypothetical protein